MAKKNQLVIDLVGLNLTEKQQRSLHIALHKAVLGEMKKNARANTENIPAKKTVKKLSTTAGKKAILTVNFTDVDAGLSDLTIVYNDEQKNIKQSDTITFTGVKPGEMIDVFGTSPGATSITIDINAKPMQMHFAAGQTIGGTFFIKS